MSLSESFSDISGQPDPDLARQASQPDLPEGMPAPIDSRLLKLRDALAGVLAIEGEQHGERRGIGRVYIFRGTLQVPADDAFATLTTRFSAVGFTPMLQRDHGEDAVIAVEGQRVEGQVKTRWWLHLGLLIVTFITTTVMGAALNGLPVRDTITAFQTWDTTTIRIVLRDGLPFSLTLLAILGVHEMGHYVAARLHGVKVTLPFFIPLPVNNSLGTMGAVIFIRSPLLNRRALFDVGIAGPLAGLVLAIPLYLIGLQQKATIGQPQAWIDIGIRRVANPPLLRFLADFVVDTPNLDHFVFYHHPMALAAWFGVLLTALNLLPLGQFDGGHVAYALLGKRAWPLALTTFFALITMGISGAWFAWLIWAVMGLLTGLRHPPPHNDLSPLGWPRTVLGIATAIVFVLIIVPVPFYAP